jgi:apolipoprotein D and lipocalin family protein
MIRKALFGLFILLAGCVGIPDSVTPVKGFDVTRYLGTWYEIARLDHLSLYRPKDMMKPLEDI